MCRTAARCWARSTASSLGDAKPPDLRRRPEGIEEDAGRLLPAVLLRLEVAISALDQLPQLPRGIDVAVAARKQPVILLGAHRLGQDRMARLGDVIMKTGLVQVARDMLGEAAAGGRDLGVGAMRKAKSPTGSTSPGATWATARRQNDRSGKRLIGIAAHAAAARARSFELVEDQRAVSGVGVGRVAGIIGFGKIAFLDRALRLAGRATRSPGHRRLPQARDSAASRTSAAARRATRPDHRSPPRQMRVVVALDEVAVALGWRGHQVDHARLGRFLQGREGSPVALAQSVFEVPVERPVGNDLGSRLRRCPPLPRGKGNRTGADAGSCCRRRAGCRRPPTPACRSGAGSGRSRGIGRSSCRRAFASRRPHPVLRSLQRKDRASWRSRSPIVRGVAASLASPFAFSRRRASIAMPAGSSARAFERFLERMHVAVAENDDPRTVAAHAAGLGAATRRWRDPLQLHSITSAGRLFTTRSMASICSR